MGCALVSLLWRVGTCTEQAGVGLLLGEQKDSPIVSVKQVVPRGSADRTGRIRVGDQVTHFSAAHSRSSSLSVSVKGLGILSKGSAAAFIRDFHFVPHRGVHENEWSCAEPSSRPLASCSSGMRGNAGFQRWLLWGSSPSTRVWLFCSKIIWCGVVQRIDCSGRTAARRAAPKLLRVIRGVRSKWRGLKLRSGILGLK